VFDVSLNEYSPDFEEAQHVSPTFDGCARQLVDRLVRDYDIRGRQVIEIGCGKGEFLALNPHKAGKFLPGTGHPVVAPEFLKQYQPAVVIAMNPAYVDEIRGTLAAMGVSANVVAV
jgi:hypothetical protein